MESFKIFMMPRFGLCKEKILLTPNQSIQRLRCDHKVKGLWHLNVYVKFTKHFSWSILLSSNKSPRTCKRRSWLNNEVRCNSESKLKLRNIKKKSPKPLPVNHKSVFLSHISRRKAFFMQNCPWRLLQKHKSPLCLVCCSIFSTFC